MSLINSAEAIYTQISNKNLGQKNFVIRGTNDSIATGSLTAGGGNNLIKFKTNQSNSNISIVSTSTDDSSAGTGARTLRINGIYIDTADDNRMKHKSTIWALNGTTPVSDPTTGTNGFVAVNSMEVITAGTHLVGNLGEITAEFSVGELVNLIRTGAGQSHTAIYAVRKGKDLLVKEINITTMLQTACVISIYVANLDNGTRVIIDKIPVKDNESINHQLNLLVEEHHIIYAIVKPLEPVIGSNHLSINMSAVET